MTLNNLDPRKNTSFPTDLVPITSPLTIFAGSTCLGGDLLFELLDLVVHDLELGAHAVDLLLHLEQALGVQVAVAPHGLVQVLLLLEAAAAARDLLVQLADLDVL